MSRVSAVWVLKPNGDAGQLRRRVSSEYRNAEFYPAATGSLCRQPLVRHPAPGGLEFYPAATGSLCRQPLVRHPAPGGLEFYPAATGSLCRSWRNAAAGSGAVTSASPIRAPSYPASSTAAKGVPPATPMPEAATLTIPASI